MIGVKIEGLDGLKKGSASASKELPKQFRNGIFKATNLVKNTAQNLAPFKTTNLRRSIHGETKNGGFTGIVYQNPHEASYGASIEFGTKPHIIRPTTMKALYWKGALHPMKMVNHPGFKGKPYMRPALDMNMGKITEIFKNIAGDMIKIIKVS